MPVNEQALSTPWSNPMGTDGFEFVEYTAPDPEALGQLFERLGFRAVARHRTKNVTLYRQGDVNFIVNAEPDSFGQTFARVHGPIGLRDGLPRQGRGGRLQRARRARREAGAGQGRPDGAQHPGHRGHRRQPDLSGRPLRRRARSTTSTSCRRRAATGDAEGRRPHRHRPPHAQRASRQHGRLGRLLRAALQLPRDPLFRHRGQADRPAEPRR